MPPVTLDGAELLFASPLFSYSVATCDTLNGRLLDEISALRQRDQGVPRSVHGDGWHSREDFFVQTGPACVELQQAVVAAVHDATRRVAAGFPFDRWRLICEGWVNLLGPGAGHTPHVHPAHHWSGVYWVLVPPPAEDSGQLELLDPRTSVGMPPLEGAACFHDTRVIQPVAGRLVVLPSYVRHWVYPNRQRQPRVAVAFNGRWVRR